MQHVLLRCAPPRSACPCGSHVQNRQVAGRYGQRTCDIHNYAARSLPTGPSLRHGPPLLAFDAAHRDRAPARRSLVPHLRALAPYSCHCSQHLAVKTSSVRIAKASLSNRPLFECLRKKKCCLQISSCDADNLISSLLHNLVHVHTPEALGLFMAIRGVSGTSFVSIPGNLLLAPASYHTFCLFYYILCHVPACGCASERLHRSRCPQLNFPTTYLCLLCLPAALFSFLPQKKKTRRPCDCFS